MCYPTIYRSTSLSLSITLYSVPTVVDCQVLDSLVLYFCQYSFPWSVTLRKGLWTHLHSYFVPVIALSSYGSPPLFCSSPYINSICTELTKIMEFSHPFLLIEFRVAVHFTTTSATRGGWTKLICRQRYQS